MRTNNRKTARQTRALALDSVGIKKRPVIILPLIEFRFLLHDSHVGFGNAEPPGLIVISNALEKSLSCSQRQRNEAMKHNRVSDCERQNDQKSSDNDRDREPPHRSPGTWPAVWSSAFPR